MGKWNETELKEQAKVFKALAHPFRIKIVEVLYEEKMGIGAEEIMKRVGNLTPGNFYYHLRLLGDLTAQDIQGKYLLTEKSKGVVRRHLKSGEDGIPINIFKKLSHPLRIKIMKVLAKGAMRFSELRDRVGNPTYGDFDYHLKFLGDLITQNIKGQFLLTEKGEEVNCRYLKEGDTKTNPIARLLELLKNWLKPK